MNIPIYLLVERSLGWNLMRTVLSTIDAACYQLVTWVLQAIFDVANANILSETLMENFQNRIYIIIGIFMLFRIAIILLNYLINPDKMVDKQAGVGKLITRTAVAIIMLIGFPFVFKELESANIQDHLLEAIPRIIIGKNTNVSDLSSSDEGERLADTIAWTTYQIAITDTSGNPPGEFNTVSAVPEHVNDPLDDDSSIYKYRYTPLIGTLLAVVMFFFLVSICIDVAIRSFKLIILRLLAPIPILSYIEPKSSQSGGTFSTWVKTLVTTWLDLFIKIGVLYFILYMIDLIILSGGIQYGNVDDNFRQIIVQIVIIIGLLFFAKEAPRFITNALGIKSQEGGGFFNGLSKLAAAGAIGAGAIGSAVASGRASYLADEANGNSHRNPLNMMKNFGAGLFGGISGVATGTKAALGAKDHQASAAMQAMQKRNANAIAMGAAGSTGFGRAMASANNLLLGQGLAAEGKRRIENLENFNNKLNAVQDRAKSEMVKQDWTRGKLSSGMAGTVNYKDFKARMDSAMAQGHSNFQYEIFDDTTGNSLGYRTISMDDAQRDIGYLEKTNQDSFIVENVNGGAHADDLTRASIMDAEAASTERGFKITGRASITNQKDQNSIALMKEKRANAKREANDKFAGKNK